MKIQYSTTLMAHHIYQLTCCFLMMRQLTTGKGTGGVLDGTLLVRRRGLRGAVPRLQHGGPRHVVRLDGHLRGAVPFARRARGYRIRRQGLIIENHLCRRPNVNRDGLTFLPVRDTER